MVEDWREVGHSVLLKGSESWRCGFGGLSILHPESLVIPCSILSVLYLIHLGVCLLCLCYLFSLSGMFSILDFSLYDVYVLCVCIKCTAIALVTWNSPRK